MSDHSTKLTIRDVRSEVRYPGDCVAKLGRFLRPRLACEFSPMALCCSPVEGGATLEATPGKQPRAVAGLDLAT